MRAKRRSGSGGLSRVGDYFVASVFLVDGRRIRRKRRSMEEAELALAELLETFAAELGYFYSLPRPVPFGSREPARSGVNPRLRFTILERDGFRCVYCGATAADERLTVDHRISVADGGTDDPDNLATACEPCNLGKGSRSSTVPAGRASSRLALQPVPAAAA